MARVLIVDDEEGFRRQLEIGLSNLGHEIRSASSGRQGVDIGVRFRPDLLVTDWMLKDDIHGMHVIQVLRSVQADLRAILMTGFASSELRDEAGGADIQEFIEKPFSLERIRKAVEDTLGRTVPGRQRALLAAMAVGSNGEILHANEPAFEMMDDTQAGRQAGILHDMFSADSPLDLDSAVDHWVVVRPVADRRIAWHIRTQEPADDGSRLVVLRRGDGPQHLGLPLIEMLLGSVSPQHAQWPFDGRTVIVDRDAATRRWLISMLENTGAGCYAVESGEQALRLLGNDDGLQFAVLDHETAGEGLADLVDRIQSDRPDVVLVGSSQGDHRQAFESAGVSLFLQMPWQARDLINLLTGRIGDCVGCGMPLPLRRPRTGEPGESWVCVNCGAAYLAVLDEDASPDTIRIVRRRNDPTVE